MDLFHKLNKEKRKTIILITHSEELASETDRIIHIKDGSITEIVDNKKKDDDEKKDLSKGKKEQANKKEQK